MEKGEEYFCDSNEKFIHSSLSYSFGKFNSRIINLIYVAFLLEIGKT